MEDQSVPHWSHPVLGSSVRGGTRGVCSNCFFLRADLHSPRRPEDPPSPVLASVKQGKEGTLLRTQLPQQQNQGPSLPVPGVCLFFPPTQRANLPA